jgi:DNA-directed RNA polymerase subunit beta'
MKSTQEILELEKALLKLENLHASFDYLRISIASPKKIKMWSERKLPNGRVIGEVIRPETINFRTHQPELYGLFCEQIFGPIKNWKCKCGKYNGLAIDKICEECNVEVIEARVRRYRMGYIDLTCPVTHLWYLKGVPSYLCVLLRCYDSSLKVSELEQIIYFKEGSRFILPDHPLYDFFYYYEEKKKSEISTFFLNNLKKEQNKSEDNPRTIFKDSGHKLFKRKGAEIIKAALENINIEFEIKLARCLTYQNCLIRIRQNMMADKSFIRRIRILESFLSTKTNPSWMVLTTLPVLPPNLRPLVELESGRLVAADVNEIYRLIITRNQRLFDFLHRYLAPDLISVQGRKLLQEGIDSLIDNARLPKNKTFCLNNKPLKSLTEILEGKQGRFRQSLLGKRVDYSGRSVIVVGPQLRLNQCGLPYEMGVELFQPFLINELLKNKIQAPSHNTKLAHIIIKKNKPFIWNLLEFLTKKHCILLNRAPTLHRFGIQAFDPVIVLGQAIHLHPLVCTGFNADFDGDQMAVHLPLYKSSQLETRTMMRPSYNILSPSNGEVILKPTQDMVIGCYYLTLMIQKNKFPIKKWFANEKDALISFYQKKISVHNPILVRYSASSNKAAKKKKLRLDLILLDNSINSKAELLLNKKDKIEIELYKAFKYDNIYKTYYFITSIGILIARPAWSSSKKMEYEVTDLFLETTAGRIIFSINFTNLIKK